MPAKSRERRSSPCVGWSHAEIHTRRRMSSLALLALDQLGAGVIVIGNCGLVIEMNRAAEAIVHVEDGLLVREGLFCARRVFETAKLAKLIAGATEAKSRPAARRMLIERSGGLPPYLLTVMPLRSDLVNRGGLAMIVVVDPARHCPSEKDLAEFFGLSPAETRVATALMIGKRLSDIADEASVQITTVRTQLRSILRKVGVKRQFDLVRMLSGTGLGSISFSAWWLDATLAVAQLPACFAA
jgi:DNA-binding CsgD family transcriptional regulator